MPSQHRPRNAGDVLNDVSISSSDLKPGVYEGAGLSRQVPMLPVLQLMHRLSPTCAGSVYNPHGIEPDCTWPGHTRAARRATTETAVAEWIGVDQKCTYTVVGREARVSRPQGP